MCIYRNLQLFHSSYLLPLFLIQGPVLKFNCNQRYATTAITAAFVREAAVLADVPLQDYVVRNDSACGSTIGPILSAKLGMRTAGKHAI